MIKLITKNFDGTQTIKNISHNETITPTKSQQLFFNNQEGQKYTFNLVDGEKSIELVFLDKDGQHTKIKLENMVELIKSSDVVTNESSKTVLGIIDDKEGMDELEQTALNSDFQGDNVISELKELLASSSQGEDFLNGIIIDDFGALVEVLDAAAAGEDESSSGTFTNTSLEASASSYSVDSRASGTSYEDANTSSGEVNIELPTEATTPTEPSTPETEDSEVEINEGTIRLDEAPEYGTIQILVDGEWIDMEVGKEYPKDSEVKFVPDSEKIDEETKDFFVGSKDPNNASLDDWGEVNGDTAVFKQNGVTITTKLSGGQDIVLHKGTNPKHGVGIGDKADRDGNGISGDETLTVSVDGANVNQITFNLAGLGPRFDGSNANATKIVIKAYDKDGNLIEVQSGYRDPNSDNIYESAYTFSMNGNGSSKIAYFVLGTDGGKGTFVVRSMTVSKTVYDDTEFTSTNPDGTEETIKKDINIPNADKDKEIPMDDEYIPPVDEDSVEFTFENQLKDDSLDSIEITKLPKFGKLLLEDGTEVKEGDIYPKDTKFKYVNDGENSSEGDKIIFKGVDSSTGEKSDDTSLVIKDDEEGPASKLLSEDADLESIINQNNEIDLNNGRADELKINLDELTDILDESNELKIFGETGDEIILEGGNSSWENQGKQTIDGETFDVYSGSTPATSNIKILIDEDVSVNSDL